MNQANLCNDIDHSLCSDAHPSLYLKQLADSGLFRENYPFTLLEKLKNVEQPPKYHPEGNVWEHTLLVIDQVAARRDLSQNPRVLMWAALLHDLGKITTTKVRRGRITSYDHDREGAGLAADFLRECQANEDFIDEVVRIVRWHMQPLYVNKQLPFANLKKMLKEVPLDEIALFCLCDRLGRGDMSEEIQQAELADIGNFIEACQESLISS